MAEYSLCTQPGFTGCGDRNGACSGSGGLEGAGVEDENLRCRGLFLRLCRSDSGMRRGQDQDFKAGIGHPSRFVFRRSSLLVLFMLGSAPTRHESFQMGDVDVW